ncbi:MAG: phosphomannomutase [Methylococcaceae bacterium]|nr:phosphomannomutase [Methylococcaceae bacterium]
MRAKINELMAISDVQFGTSGVRGLVKDMTDKVCFAYVTAFLCYINEKDLGSVRDKRVGIAGDLRNSTPRIMNAVAAACIELGLEPINYGYIPSPAIALYGLKLKIPTIMVTGSHIPDDRNGIKFNMPEGEILKADEQGIRAQQVQINGKLFDEKGQLKKVNYLAEEDSAANQYYIQRFINFFPKQCLVGKRVGLYEHSSVSRDCLKIILEQLGADVTSLGRSKRFISVDTEAIRPEDVELAKQWTKEHHFDCIISADGDGDRPLISDELGNWLRGDVAGIVCAKYLKADTVITPVSSNTSVEKSQLFKRVIRTKIGSPYVIEAMQQAYAETGDSSQKIVGYEANGGFLQQTSLSQGNRILLPLPTRDAVIVFLAVILWAQNNNKTISQSLTLLPQRYTFSGRLKGMATEKSQKLLDKLTLNDTQTNLENIKALFPCLTMPVSIDTTDGVRITLESSEIVHLRPSGNAPELRCYTESLSEEKARYLCNEVMTCISVMKMEKV